MSPATAGAVAAARRAVAPSRATGPAYANGAGQETHESDAARPEPLPDLPLRPPRTVDNAPTDDGVPRSRLGAIIAGVVTLLVIAVVLVVVLSSGGDKPTPAGNEIGDATPPPVAAPPPAPATAKVDRANTQIAVLNGTTTTGLARGVADKLEKSGFTILSVGDNADQAMATTTISYSRGNERAARTVAQIMDVSSSAVKLIDANTSVAVAPEAKVVVVVGNDRSTTG